MRSVSVSVVVAAGVVSTNAALQRITPLEKVTGMLEEVRTKVTEEGTAEAKTYNKFACFCKDTMAAKTEAIDTARTEKDSLQARMNEAGSARGEADDGIAAASEAINEAEVEIERLNAERHETRLTYEKNEIDLTGAIQALNSALHELKAAKTSTASLAQMRATGKLGLVRRALLMAEVLSPLKAERASKALSALQTGAPEEQYGFHSDEIVSMIQDLETQFKAQKDTLDKAEVDSKKTHNTAVKDQDTILLEQHETLKGHQTARGEQTEIISTTSQDLTTVAATLLDDQAYLSDVSKQCNAKAVLWDQRTQLRANEIQAISQAVEIMKGIQVDAPAPSFVQVSSHHPAKATPAKAASARTSRLGLNAVKGALKSRSAKVAEMLLARGKKLNSEFLVFMAAQARADPFKKIKQMIQDLVEKLLKEAAEEASHKGWCDGELQAATKVRDDNAKGLEETNGRLAVGEARRAKLTELLGKVTTEIDELKVQLQDAEDPRAMEKEQNTASIDEAKIGLDATNEAIRILSEYYGAAAKGKTTSLVQQKNEPVPDAGFDDEYTGDQSSSTGVLGMLDVCASDFQRTIDDTTAAEKKGEKDLNEFQTVAGSSLAEKEEASKAHTSALDEANAEDEADRQGLVTHQETMDTALAELESLTKACFDTGLTPEERKAKREEELGALQNALCILDSSNGGTDC
jgi:hypothetical protein